MVNGKYNATFDLVLYLLYEKLNISLTCDGTTPFQYLKRIVAMQDSTLSEAESQFFFKDEWQLWESEGVDANKDVKFWKRISI